MEEEGDGVAARLTGRIRNGKVWRVDPDVNGRAVADRDGGVVFGPCWWRGEMSLRERRRIKARSHFLEAFAELLDVCAGGRGEAGGMAAFAEELVIVRVSSNRN